jgi:pimeloyl-ACP methyl ester carboxylesterase
MTETSLQSTVDRGDKTSFVEQRDPYLNRGVAEVLRSHLKHASLTVLPAGHWVQSDVPEQVAAIMLGDA